MITKSSEKNKIIFDNCKNSKPLYKGSTVSSTYIEMDDLVKIAIDIILPQNLELKKKIPCIMIMTRYWRSFSMKTPNQGKKAPMGPRRPIADYLNANGYAVIIADARGTGASYGTWEYPFSTLEINDFNKIGQWILKQPWSNGKIASLGTSYEGSTAEILCSAKNSVINCAISKETEFDIYTDIAFPGGIRNEWFAKTWGDLNYNLDNNIVPKNWGFSANLIINGVSPVSNDKNGNLLSLAVKDHKKNINIEKSIHGIAFKNNPLMPRSLTLDDISFFNRKEKIENSNIPILSWGSWMDGATANAAIHKFLNLKNIKKIIIGSWSHNLKTDGNPYEKSKSKVNPNCNSSWNECLKFLSENMGDSVSNISDNKRYIYYYTMGEDKWKKTENWPPENIINKKWYFNKNNSLSTSAPKDRGFDIYPIDFSASTGNTNRWHTLDGSTPVIYKNRKSEDLKLLTYTSEPLEKDTEITGHPLVELNIKSTANDGAFYVYLEDVDEKENVTYITEGQLRGIHRKISNSEAKYKTIMPFHTFLREDAKPIKPTEITNISFCLLPTSVLIKKGHKIRIAIAGHDKDTFARIPKKDSVVINILRDNITPSYIFLPIRSK